MKLPGHKYNVVNVLNDTEKLNLNKKQNFLVIKKTTDKSIIGILPCA